MNTLPDNFVLDWGIIDWVIRICALVLLLPQRSPAAARSWLLLIFFLPIPGLALFLLIGSSRFPAWRTERFETLRPYFAKSSEALAAFAPTLDEIAATSRLATNIGFMPATGDNSVDLIEDYDAVIDQLVADIATASASVILLVYIFADDEIGRRVIEALRAAAKRGVQVRVMFDAVGSRPWQRSTSQLLIAAGVEVQQAMPFRLLRRLTRRDMRNHRKLFVIDGWIGYAGSQNIVANGFNKGIVNRELVARVTGPVVASMATLVCADWALEAGTPPERGVEPRASGGTAVAQLLPSGADYPLAGFETLLVSKLYEARDRVIIVTPYFVPDDNVKAAMATAAARGVIVDLVVSKVVDQAIVRLAQESYYDALLAAGIRIHLFREALLHAKTVLIDQQLAVVGSSNVDLRSFQLNEEASLLLYDGGSVAQVQAIQLGYLANSELLVLESWRRRPALRRLSENLARLLSPLL